MQEVPAWKGRKAFAIAWLQGATREAMELLLMTAMQSNPVNHLSVEQVLKVSGEFVSIVRAV